MNQEDREANTIFTYLLLMLIVGAMVGLLAVKLQAKHCSPQPSIRSSVPG